MTMMNSQNSWNVGRVSGRCQGCGTELPPNAVCWAALCDRPLEVLSPAEKTAESKAKKGEEKSGGGDGGGNGGGSPFVRVDFCEKCWAAGKRPAEPLTAFSFWKTTVPVPEQKKKLLVDDSVLVDVFSRMEEKREPQEVRFRFVLALILMRKRLLKYEGTEAGEAAGGESKSEIWRMMPRGSEEAVHVINPHLTEEQVTEVSQQLSAILAEEV